MARSDVTAQSINDTGWKRVTSTNVKQVRHIGAPVNQLHVRFKGGGGGFYSDVPRAVFHRIMAAASKGKFVHRVLKAQYSWTRYDQA